MKKTLFLATSIFSAIQIFAHMGSLSFSVGIPQNEFKKSTDAIGLGADFTLGFPFQRDIPIYYGFDLNYMVYGRSTRNQNVSASVKNQTGATVASATIPLKVIHYSSFFGGHAMVRGFAPFDAVIPYGEVLFGFRNIATGTRIRERSNGLRWFGEERPEVIADVTTFDDSVLSYGFGGGLFVKIGFDVYLDFRVTFFRGQRARYYHGEDTEAWEVVFSEDPYLLDDETFSKEDLIIGTAPRESTTDLLLLKFGIAFKLQSQSTVMVPRKIGQ